MDSNIQKRLQEAIDSLCNGNKSEFCRRIGKDVSSLKDIIGEKHSAPGYGLLFAILSSDLGISPNWLMIGEGPMLSGSKPSPAGNDVHDNNVVIIGNLGDLKEVVAEAIRENR